MRRACNYETFEKSTKTKKVCNGNKKEYCEQTVNFAQNSTREIGVLIIEQPNKYLKDSPISLKINNKLTTNTSKNTEHLAEFFFTIAITKISHITQELIYQINIPQVPLT